jgi:hypothetical protein
MSESELYAETFLTLLFWDPVKNQKKEQRETSTVTTLLILRLTGTM